MKVSNNPLFIKRRVISFIILFVVIALALFAAQRAYRWYIDWQRYSGIERLEGKIKSGQDLFSSIIETGLERKQANEILNSLNGILDFTKLQIEDRYQIFVKDGLVQKFIYEKSPIDQYYVVRDEEGRLRAFKPGIELKKETIVKTFTIESSLFNAINKRGETDALVFSVVDIFAWDVDFNLDPRVGDTIRIYFEKYYLPDGKFVKYGRIQAAQYGGTKTYKAVYFPAKKGYYSLKGNPVAKMFLKSPLKFTGRITSYFGRRRDPFTSRHSGHRGVDFAAYYGAPIVATSKGSVTYSGWRGAYGRMVEVRHTNGYKTRYGHCTKIYVRVGQRVSQGEVIAGVGSTGRSTGPHCHYEVRLNNAVLNPLRFSQPVKKPLKGKDLKEFKKYSKTVWSKLF
ncbi:MAG: M23 family metallopeptidase [Candidatus Saganbacteria bacterium]|nr:M23 family metallopeptidase [Candidatus Saganbacteria bacterium]